MKLSAETLEPQPLLLFQEFYRDQAGCSGSRALRACSTLVRYQRVPELNPLLSRLTVAPETKRLHRGLFSPRSRTKIHHKLPIYSFGLTNQISKGSIQTCPYMGRLGLNQGLTSPIPKKCMYLHCFKFTVTLMESKVVPWINPLGRLDNQEHCRSAVSCTVLIEPVLSCVHKRFSMGPFWIESLVAGQHDFASDSILWMSLGITPSILPPAQPYSCAKPQLRDQRQAETRFQES